MKGMAFILFLETRSVTDYTLQSESRALIFRSIMLLELFGKNICKRQFLCTSPISNFIEASSVFSDLKHEGGWTERPDLPITLSLHFESYGKTPRSAFPPVERKR
jgi:hypothetical protein